MINKILILSRKMVQHCICYKQLDFGIKGKWALISIFRGEKLIETEEQKKTLKNLNCLEYLDLQFADIQQPIEHEIFFNEEHAQYVIDFIDKIKTEIGMLVVHCHAGVSRSGAIGLFTCKYLGLNENVFWLRNSNIMPNNHVLNVLGKISKIDIKYKEDNIKYQKKYKKFKSLF